MAPNCLNAKTFTTMFLLHIQGFLLLTDLMLSMMHAYVLRTYMQVRFTTDHSVFDN